MSHKNARLINLCGFRPSSAEVLRWPPGSGQAQLLPLCDASIRRSPLSQLQPSSVAVFGCSSSHHIESHRQGAFNNRQLSPQFGRMEVLDEGVNWASFS